MSSQLRDKLLLYRIQTKRDAEAYAELYDTYVAGVYRFVSFKVATRELAEDITSEAFLRAWHYLLESHDVMSFAGLIYRIARNLVIDHYRAKRITVSLDENIEADTENEILSDEGVQLELMENSIEAERVIEAMKDLKEDYRDVLMLKFVDQLSTGEIAEILGKTSVHVRVLIHRASQTLKNQLEEKK